MLLIRLQVTCSIYYRVTECARIELSLPPGWFKPVEQFERYYTIIDFSVRIE